MATTPDALGAHEAPTPERAVLSFVGRASAGTALGVLSLAGLFASETAGLSGFVDHGYRMAIVVAIVAEAAAVMFLVTFLVADGTGLQNLRRR